MIGPVREALAILVGAMLVVLAIGLVVGRVPLPGGDSFGFNSFARNVVIVAIVAHLFGAPGLRLSLSPIGGALLAYAAVAAASVLVNRGSFSDVRLLANGVGMFLVARALAASPARRRWLVDGLGAIAVGIVVRELAHDPSIALLREASRQTLVTDHPNTLGYALAVLLPVFLAGALGPPATHRPRCALYAAAAAFGIAATYSRAAWIAAAVSSITVATAASRRRLRTPLLAALCGLAFAVLVAAAIGEISLGREAADQQRLRIIQASLTLFREHWPIGVGFGVKNLERVFPSRYIELYGASLFLFHSHNFYVDALAGTGVVGAAATAWLVARLVSLARRARRVSPRGMSEVEASAIAATIATFLAIGLVDMPLYHARLTLLVAVALAVIERRVEEGERAARAIADVAPCP